MRVRFIIHYEYIFDYVHAVMCVFILLFHLITAAPLMTFAVHDVSPLSTVCICDEWLNDKWAFLLFPQIILIQWSPLKIHQNKTS